MVNAAASLKHVSYQTVPKYTIIIYRQDTSYEARIDFDLLQDGRH